jgi:hypothetical protein
MRKINIWIVLAILLALLAITRYLRDERDIRLERVCADNPSASECQDRKNMKIRTHFTYRIEMLNAGGEIQEHLAGVEDFVFAKAVWREAIVRWPRATIPS